MKLNFNQLGTHLQQNLAAVYLISGDEPFQLDEATRLIREAARQQGYSERQVFHVERGFDWQQLNQAADSLSLFAERKLLELRLPSAKPGDVGSKALQTFCDNPPEDTLLLIVCGKLESAQTKSKWVKAIENVGVTLSVWPLDARQLPAWLQQRMQLRGLQPTPQALSLLAQLLEGNLLAADQELEKLHMIFGDGAIDAEQVLEAVNDSARYDAFALVDAALAGDGLRVSRILHGLRAEGVEILAVLGALFFQLRSLEKMALEMAQGQSLESVLNQYRVWDKRKPLISQGLQRHGVKRWQAFLLMAGRLDRMAKGLITGKPWDELLQLCLRIAGVALFPIQAEQVAVL